MTAIIHVSPTRDDSGSGTADAPLRTLSTARDKARALRSDGTTGLIEISLDDGTYAQTTPLTLGPEDSNLLFIAAKGATPRVTGARILDMSQAAPVTDEAIRARLPEAVRDQVVQIDLRAQGITDLGVREPQVAGAVAAQQPSIVIGNRQLVDARYPNEGWLTIAEDLTGAGNPVWRVDDLRPGMWADPTAAWVCGFPYFMWAWQTFNVAAVGATASTVEPSPASQYGNRVGNPFYFFHVLEELDTPEEFFVDHSSGLAYFIPSDGEEVRFTTMTEPVVVVDGADYVKFRGITIADSRGRGIRVANSTNTLIVDSTFVNLGLEAVDLLPSANHSGVSSTTFSRLGNGGVILDGGDRATLSPGFNFVEDSSFTNVSEAYVTYSPGIRVRGVGNRASHNEISQLPHTAIQMNGNEHTIERNHIHHVVQDSADAGAIYAGRDWTERGNVIRHNFLHDVGAPGADAIGVYLDDMISGTLVLENTFVDVPKAVQHSGRNNVVAGNLVCRADTPVFIGTWGGGAQPELRARLVEVPYQCPVWVGRYPELAEPPLDRPRDPVDNAVVDNTFIACGGLDIRPVPAQTLLLSGNRHHDSATLPTPPPTGPRLPGTRARTGLAVRLFIARTTVPLGARERVWVIALNSEGTALPVAQTGEFASSDSRVATISAGGLLVAAGDGVTTITWSTGDKTGPPRVEVIVAPPAPTGLRTSLTGGRFLTVGSSVAVSAQLDLSDGATAAAKTDQLQFESTDPAIAGITAEGVVTALAAGTATLTTRLSTPVGTWVSTQPVVVHPAGDVPPVDDRDIRLAAVGDSITEADSPCFAEGRLGHGSWLTHALGHPLSFGGGHAHGGATTRDLHPMVEPWEADVLVVLAGSYDVATGMNLGGAVDTVRAIAVSSRVPRIVVAALPPNADRGQAVRLLDYNRRLRAMAERQGFWFLDPWSPLRAPDGTWRLEHAHTNGAYPTPEAAAVAGARLRKLALTLFDHPTNQEIP